jgi:hypothetical protein
VHLLLVDPQLQVQVQVPPLEVACQLEAQEERKEWVAEPAPEEARHKCAGVLPSVSLEAVAEVQPGSQSELSAAPCALRPNSSAGPEIAEIYKETRRTWRT